MGRPQRRLAARLKVWDEVDLSGYAGQVDDEIVAHASDDFDPSASSGQAWWG